jgi:hypothetical protein
MDRLTDHTGKGHLNDIRELHLFALSDDSDGRFITPAPGTRNRGADAEFFGGPGKKIRIWLMKLMKQ